MLAGDDGSGHVPPIRTALAPRTPAVPPKFAEDGRDVLARAGTDHTAYVLKTVVDAHFDLRADQIMKAAAVLQKIGRGAAVRRMRAPAAKKRVPQHASPQERRAPGRREGRGRPPRRRRQGDPARRALKAVRKKEAAADGVGNSLWALRSRFAIVAAKQQSPTPTTGTSGTQTGDLSETFRDRFTGTLPRVAH